MKAREKFIELLGEDYLNALERDNWIEFVDIDAKFQTEESYKIRFKRKDGKGDTVIFSTIHYADGKWWKNYDDEYPEKVFDSFEDLKALYESEEDKRSEWGETSMDL